jgi:tRNA (cmo5U34)-methyltransferase
MTVLDFAFADYTEKFDEHISPSIPGYPLLRGQCAGLSRRFIQRGTNVIDIGCTTGTLLRSVRDANQPARPGVRYVGIDIEPKFSSHWRANEASDVAFAVKDARSYEGFEDLSVALCLFTIQFLAPRDKVGVLQKVYDGLVPGGALLIAEKVLATSARFQDALTFDYYDFKRRTFSADKILDKERSLCGFMTCWTENELTAALRKVGFAEMQTIWMSFPFKAVLALKES